MTNETPPTTPDPMRLLNRLVQNTPTVSDLVTRPLWCLKPSLSARDAISAMEANGFDIAGVSGPTIKSFVRKSALETSAKRVRQSMEPILAAQCVERTLPIGQLFEILRKQDHVFVLDGSEIRWIINHADLSASAVSIAVLAHLAAIEEGIKAIASRYQDSEVLEAMRRGLEKAEDLFQTLRSRGIDVGLLDCFLFGDWMDFVANTPEVLTSLGFASKNKFENFTGPFGDLRNDTAHGRGILTNSNPKQALSRVQRVLDLATRVWNLVEEQQPIWDRFAETQIVYSARRRTPIAGVGARKRPSWTGTAHVITASNPGGIWSTQERNAEANFLLKQTLQRHGLTGVPVTGRSRDGVWREESFLIETLSRQQASELGANYGQTAIFEIDAAEVRVVRCSDAKVLRTRPRIH